LDALIAGLLVGLFVASLLFCILYLGVILMGMAVGFIFWVGFHTLFPNAISNNGGLYTLMVIAIIAGGVIAAIFQHLTLSIFTSIIGAFFFSQGLDYFTDTNFNIFNAIHNQKTCDEGYCFAIALAFLIVAVVGFLVQEGITKRLWPSGKSQTDEGCLPCCCIPLPF